jgi:hypothetical protein
MSSNPTTRPSINSASTQLKFDHEPYLRVLPAVSGINHTVIFAGFDPVRFTNANGEIIEYPDGTDLYHLPRKHLITAALENAASKLNDTQWGKLCKNDPEILQILVDDAKQTYYAKSDLPEFSRSQKLFSVRDARLVLACASMRPPTDHSRNAESYRPAMSFQPTVTFLSHTNVDNNRPAQGLAEVWIQLDGTALPGSPGSPDTPLRVEERALASFAKQLSRVIPAVFRDQLRSLNTDASAAESADTAEQIGNLVGAHFEFLTGWNGRRKGVNEPRESESPPCWESEGLTIPISSETVSLKVDARFDGRPRTLTDRNTGTRGGSSAGKEGEGAVTSDFTRLIRPAQKLYSF